MITICCVIFSQQSAPIQCQHACWHWIGVDCWLKITLTTYHHHHHLHDSAYSAEVLRVCSAMWIQHPRERMILHRICNLQQLYGKGGQITRYSWSWSTRSLFRSTGVIGWHLLSHPCELTWPNTDRCHDLMPEQSGGRSVSSLLAYDNPKMWHHKILSKPATVSASLNNIRSETEPMYHAWLVERIWFMDC